MTPDERLSPAARRIVNWLAPREWRESMCGDLAEEQGRRAARGRAAGPTWAVWAAISTCMRLAIARQRDLRRAGSVGTLRGGLPLDFRQTLRALSAERGYAITTVATLALGIGATTAVFSLTNALLLRPIPGVVDPARLVTIYLGGGSATGLVSVRTVDALASAVPALERIAGTNHFAAANLELGGVARRVHVEVVTGGYFEVLGGAIGEGRGFSADEGRDPSAAPVVVLSDSLWRQAFGASPAAPGATVIINGDHWTVIGVAAPGFHGPSRTGQTDAWVPVAQYARVLPGYGDVLNSPRTHVFMTLIGRMAAGGTPAAVNSEAEVIRARLASEMPNDLQLKRFHFLVRPGLVDLDGVREELRSSMTLLGGFVALLLILTAANTGNLMFMRALGRRAELATHAALGASRPRLIRLLLVESVTLATIGGLLALGLCALAGHMMAGTIVLSYLPPISPPAMDWRVFGFAAALSACVAVGAGVLPAMSGSRTEMYGAMRDVTRSNTSGRRRARHAMAVVQLALSLILLVGALLLARSMAMRRAINPGFDPSDVLVFSVDPGLERYDAARMAGFYQTLLARTRALPGVRAAGVALLAPLSNNADDNTIRAEGQPESINLSAEHNFVSPGVFDGLGLRLVTGHDFTEADFLRPTPQDGPAIVTASLARKLFGTAQPIGRRIILKYPPGATRLVTGVVTDLRQRQFLEPPADALFEPISEAPDWSSVIIGLTRRTDASTVAAAAQRVVAAIDPAMPIYDVGTLDREVDRQLATESVLATLSRVFAGLATALAAVGLYGVLARSVAERRREFGIRLALGARPMLVARLVARDSVIVVLAGAVLGLGASALLVRLIESRLFEISPWDPFATSGALALLTFVALVATQPAIHRATHVDPVEVLRE